MGRDRALETKVKSLRSQSGKVSKARDDGTGSADERGRQTRMLDSLIRVLNDELDSLERKESTECDAEIVNRRVSDA